MVENALGFNLAQCLHSTIIKGLRGVNNTMVKQLAAGQHKEVFAILNLLNFSLNFPCSAYSYVMFTFTETGV